jgi:hypothetical protein
MASARTILATLGFLQLLAVGLNFWSPLLFYMLPVAILASLILWVSVYYNWKRGSRQKLSTLACACLVPASAAAAADGSALGQNVPYCKCGMPCVRRHAA